MGAGRSLMRVENEGDQVEVLTGGNMGAVTRVGGTVHRRAGEWTPAVHRLLRHCREAGFSAAPEPLGITDDGHEILSFVEGTVPSYPMPVWIWSREALDSSARLMREYHDATTGCGLSGPWRSPSHEPVEVICHYDFAPYNISYQNGGAVGIIDFDYASPGPRLWDLAYLAYRIVPVSTDHADGFTFTERAARLRRLLEVYGSTATPADLLDMIVERLLDLATFSETMAGELGKPALNDHAAFYRKDAEAIVRGR